MNRPSQGIITTRGMPVVIGVVALVAFLFRLIPLLSSGTLGGFRGYDDGVHYAAGVHLIWGSLPYRDFVLVHPPGIALLMVPFATVGSMLGDFAGTGTARLLVVLVGTANTLFVGMLLRRWGYAAVLAGSGIYSVSSVATIAERSIMLSPLLTLCTLSALLILRGPAQRNPQRAMMLAAAVLGFALTVKLWAILPIAVVATMVGARFGLKLFLRFAISGVLTCVVIMGPFFLVAPRAMFKDIIVAQLARTDGAVKGLTYRLEDFAGMPLSSWLLLLVAAVGLMSVLVAAIIGVTSGRSPRMWRDEFWWAALAAITVNSLMVSMSFFDHYPNFSLAYLSLCIGATVGLLCRMGSYRWNRTIHSLAVVGALAVLIPVGTQGFVLQPKPLPNVSNAQLAADVARYDCVFTPYSYIGVISDSLSRSMAHGCGSTVDIFGTRMVEKLGHQTPSGSTKTLMSSEQVQLQQLQSAQAAVVGKQLEYYGLAPLAVKELKVNFSLYSTHGNFQVWVRK